MLNINLFVTIIINFMFLKRGFALIKNYAAVLKKGASRLRRGTKILQFGSHLLRATPILYFVASTMARCADEPSQFEPEIHEITKVELVQNIHNDHTQEFVVIIYDKFKRLNEKQFAQELKVIIDECKTAKIPKIYLIDSKQKQHLNQIIRILKNQPIQEENEQEYQHNKKKPFQCYYKGKFFNEAIELQKTDESPINQQIAELRHFEFTANNEKINQILSDHMNNRWTINKTYVVKQCTGQGECVQSFKREIKKLIEGGMLTGKKDEYKFELIIDQPTGILSSSSEYVKNFMKCAEKLKEKSINPHKKQQIYVFRKDLFGNDVTLFSEWLEREGLNYASNDRFIMFIKPRINIISKINTLPDLLWYLRTAKLNNQISISLNNIPKVSKSNSKESLEILNIVRQHFPNLNYLIVNSQKVNELIRHLNSDHKYVVFKQDNSTIWNKEFLDLDRLESLPTKTEKEEHFKTQFKPKIDAFIDNPQINSFISVQRELQINLQKLKTLRERQLKKLSLKKYVIRVCKENCSRFLDENLVEEINAKVEEPVNVYWIDSKAQNVGVEDGDYILKDGFLQKITEFLHNI